MANACSPCTLCCKTHNIAAFDSPPGHWCPKCVAGEGCTAYDERPQACRDFKCWWLFSQSTGKPFPAKLRPDRSRCVLSEQDGKLYAHLGGDRPDALESGPMGRAIKKLASYFGGVTVVLDGRVFRKVGRP